MNYKYIGSDEAYPAYSPSEPIFMERVMEKVERKHISKSGYVLIWDGFRHKREHRLIVEKELGRDLKETEVVHHIDGNKTNNKIENLALMPRKIHSLVHRAMERFYACGNSSKRRCVICQEYDKPESMKREKYYGCYSHVSCRTEQRRKYKK